MSKRCTTKWIRNGPVKKGFFCFCSGPLPINVGASSLMTMKLLLTSILFTAGLNCYGQNNFEQSALDYFDSLIRPEFVQSRNKQTVFYFKSKSTEKLSDVDFSSTKRPLNSTYKVDFDKLGVNKCESVDKKTLNAIDLKRPEGFQYKRRYVNRHLYVYIWKLRLWKRNEKGEFNVYVDRTTKCGLAYIVNITLYPTVDSYWYNFLIYMDDNGNVIEWYYVNYIA